MAKELVYRVRIEYDSSDAAKGAQVIDNTQEQAEQSVNNTTSAIRRQQEAQEQVSRSTRNYSKVQSNANQTLFSFGDLLNDSQQFQFGFAQGTRAIGNNIGFAAEQFSQISRRAGGFRGAISALGSSLLGPGGLILGINAAVTAITVFGDELFGATEVTEEMNDELDRTVDLLKEIGELTRDENAADQLVDSIRTLDSQQERLNQRIQENKRIIDEVGITTEELNRLNELRNLRDQEGIDLTAKQTKELKRLARLQRSGAAAGVEEYRQENERLQEELEKLQEEEEDQRRKLLEVNAAHRDTSRAVQVSRKWFEEWRKTVETASDETDQFAIAVGDMPERMPMQGDGAVEGSIADLQMRIRAFESMRAKVDPSSEAFRDLSQAIREARNELEGINEESGGFSENFQQISNTVLNSASQLTSSITNLATTRAESRVREAEAAGASAERIQQLERERFEAQKKGALASAIINIAEGITSAFTPYVPGLSEARAGIVSAAGAIQIAAIKAQKFGGGGNTPQSSGRSAQEGFQTSEVQQNNRGMITGAAQNNRQQMNPTFILSGEFDDRMVSMKAERGDRKRKGRAVTIS